MVDRYSTQYQQHYSGPALGVDKSQHTKVPPSSLRSHAEQSPEPESKDVLFDFFLLLGEGKADAYIEYWFRAD